MDTLGIFVRQPIPGQTKTRLAAHVGNERATEIYVAFLHDVLERFRRTGDRRILCISPATEEAEIYFRELAGAAYEIWRQSNVGLGERLAAFFDAESRGRDDRVVVIGSDSPTLPRNIVHDAFGSLHDHECVIGPATDGGYYLIGQSGKPSPIFEKIEWSTGRVFEQTLTCIRRLKNIRLGLLPPWYDVDTADDLQLLRGHLLGLQTAGDVETLRNTLATLSQDTATDRTPL